MAYSPNLAPPRFPQYGVLYLLPNNSNISSSFANAGLTQFLSWEIFFLSAVTDFLGRPSPTRVVQSDTFIGILTTNVKYSKFTKIYIANWVNNIVYFFAKFHWTFLTFHDCIGFCSIKAKGRKQWGGFDFTGAKGQIPQSWKWIFCQLLFGTFQSRCPPVDYQYGVPTP